MSDRHNDSIQEHLTNSIRRAKQRIYSKAISAYSNNDSQYSNQQYQMRDRTNSERSVFPLPQKEDKSVLASAMKVLQEKIASLQLQNRELKKKLEMSQRQSKGKEIVRQKDDNIELSKALSELKAKQLQNKKITKQNAQLQLRNSQLNERIQELEEELEKALKNNKQQNKLSKIKKEQSEKWQIYEARVLQKDIKIIKLQQAIKELQSQNNTNKQTIQHLNNKIEEEKKMNLKWIKMYNSQLDKKQNRSITANQIQPHTQKKSIQKGMSFQVAQIHRKNKQLQQTLQRNKIKIADLNRERKKAEDKCFKIQQIALQIADQITKSMSNPPSHLKYLTAQIMKLEGAHYNDSLVNCSRKSRLEDRSGSKQRKRSLKMSDLNSSSKKSKSRSKSKITRKNIQKQSRYIIPDELLQN